MNNMNKYFIDYFKDIYTKNPDNYLEIILVEIKSLSEPLQKLLFAFLYQMDMLANVDALHTTKERNILIDIRDLMRYYKLEDYMKDTKNDSDVMTSLITSLIRYINSSDFKRALMIKHANDYNFFMPIAKINPAIIIENLNYHKQLEKDYSLKNIVKFYKAESKEKCVESQTIEFIIKRLSELKKVNEALYNNVITEIIRDYYITEKTSSMVVKCNSEFILNLLNEIETSTSEDMIKFLEKSYIYYTHVLTDYLFFKKGSEAFNTDDLYEERLDDRSKEIVKKYKKNT